MALTVITAADEEPIAIADARLQCRSSSAEDALLTSIYIPAARAAAETAMAGTCIIQRTLQQTYRTFDAAGLKFAAAPVVSITSVVYTDEAGDDVTLDPSAYTLTEVEGRAVLLAAADTTWPTTKEMPDAVRVRFVAGLAADQAAVPADLRAWLLLTVNHFYENRGAFDATGRIAALPGRFYDALLDKHRNHGF